MPIFKNNTKKILIATTAHFHTATYWGILKHFTNISELHLKVFPWHRRHSCPTEKEQLVVYSGDFQRYATGTAYLDA